MSPQSPQVLSRRANGASSGSTGQAQGSETSKGRASNKSGRGRGSSGKSNENTKNATETDAPKPAKQKPQNEGEKLVVRRLPPGMIQSEFVSILGPEWETGKGKIDWFSFAPGKISTDPSKPSRPGRAYLHVIKKDDIMALSDTVRTATWEDAKASFNSPSLIGPPAIEFAIYKKVPGNKKRSDARQGTIDQDPEFMAFLEDLANPTLPKDNNEADEAEDVAKADIKVTTTPLIEYLKEKKANKAKEAASSKSSKDARGKGKGTSKDDEPTKKKGRESRTERADNKAPKETVTILTKKSTNEQTATASKSPANQAKESQESEAPPKSRRAAVAAAARILQRDLGLSPGTAHRKARREAGKADAAANATSSKEAAPPTADERPASPVKSADVSAATAKNRSAKDSAAKGQASGRRNRGGKNPEKSKAGENGTAQASAANPPVVLLKKGNDAESSQSSTPAPSSQAAAQPSSSKAASGASGTSKGASNNKPQKKGAGVTPDATRAFVKHANPSQGVTEALLKQSLEVFGTITFLEIDKRKGFAYVDFAEHAGLAKAVSASPITVAQGTVQVLERKEKKAANSNAAPASAASGPAATDKPSGRGRRGRGGAKGNASNTNQSTAPAASGAG